MIKSRPIDTFKATVGPCFQADFAISVEFPRPFLPISIQITRERLAMSRLVLPRRMFAHAQVKGLRSRRGFWPALEQVEDRVLLSGNTYTVNSLGDTGAGP